MYETLTDIFPTEVASNILSFLEHPIASIIKGEEIIFHTCKECNRFIFPRRRVICDSCERAICLDCEVTYTSWDDELPNSGFDDKLCQECWADYISDNDSSACKFE